MSEFGPVHLTRFTELAYQYQGVLNWRIIDRSTGNAVGPQYPRERALLADFERFADQFGCNA